MCTSLFNTKLSPPPTSRSRHLENQAARYTIEMKGPSCPPIGGPDRTPIDTQSGRRISSKVNGLVKFGRGRTRLFGNKRSNRAGIYLARVGQGFLRTELSDP